MGWFRYHLGRQRRYNRGKSYATILKEQDRAFKRAEKEKQRLLKRWIRMDPFSSPVSDYNTDWCFTEPRLSQAEYVEEIRRRQPSAFLN